ncbi:MAG: hypothetical protein BZY80_05875 [SAR202 cluster bacterium Io17-Chloro-G2]|nr:MAG: hypothetical protein BZY80_05875 [SAR202 cluster bacterium Io17-Chloro-G2]
MALKIIGLILISLASLAACTGASDATTAASGQPETAGQPDAETVPAAQSENAQSQGQSAEQDQTPRGGKLVRLFVDPPTLDPHISTDATSAQIIVELYGGLVTIDENLELVPDLAESWDISLDKLVYTFHLRQDAVFHNGKPVTAEDVLWSLERASRPLTESPVVDQYLGDIVGAKEMFNGDAQSISGLKVIDGHTLEITIDAPKAYFLAKLTYPTGFVLDRENVEANPRNWFRQPNGTGPFKLERYDVGETLLLARNENYHLGPPKLGEVEMILSGGTAMLMYENDEIHLAGVTLADLDRLLDTNNPLNADLKRAPPSFSVQYIGMNVNEPPLDDPKVRQALNLAIDKQEIATIVLGDQVVPAKGILPPGFPGYDPGLTGYEFDPERARRLLAESKYGGDLEDLPPIVMTSSGSFGAAVTLDMEVVLQMWEKNLGLRVDFQRTEFATFLKDLHKRRFQMFDIGWIADYPDPENFLDILFQSESSNNHTNYDSPEVDALLLEARTETDEARRYELYNQAERKILKDAPWVPLWYSGERYILVKPNVHDYYQTPLVIPRLRYVYLTDR